MIKKKLYKGLKNQKTKKILQRQENLNHKGMKKITKLPRDEKNK